MSSQHMHMLYLPKVNNSPLGGGEGGKWGVSFQINSSGGGFGL